MRKKHYSQILTDLRDLDLAARARLLQLLLEHLVLEAELLAQALHGVLHVDAAEHLLLEGLAGVGVHFAELLQLFREVLNEIITSNKDAE